MCQAFRRRDASQKRRRRRYAEAQHRQRPPVPGIIFDRERKGSFSLSLPAPLNTAKSKTTRFIGDRGGRLRLRLRRGGRGWHRRRFEKEEGVSAAAQVLDLFDCFRQSRLSFPLKASSMKDYSSAMDNFDRGWGEPRRPFFVAWRFCGMLSILLRFVQLPSFSSFFFLSFLLSFFLRSPLAVMLGWDDLRCLLFDIYMLGFV